VGTTLPYLPFAEALRPLSDPTWAQRPTATEGEQEAQLRLFEDVLAALEHGAAEGPLVLVLEDLHWADASTLELVAFLEHAVAEIGVVVIGTYRSDEPRPQHKLSADAEVIELGPLTLDELGTLLEAAAGEELPAELTSAIHARSEGNPFFAQELLAATARGDARLPHLVRDALLRRVARLDATARTVLRIAAAAGHDAAYGLLSAAAGIPKEHLQEVLRAAVEEDVLIADRAASSFRFRHALLAEQRQLELLAQRARMYLVEPEQSERAEALSLLASELGLTAREAEVLELVARGYTNREIAESLYISVKTASVHVTHILRKLGISSRVEAAAAAHRVVRPTVR
jgi:DNA-binding NarL/FixJ family response regulator